MQSCEIISEQKWLLYLFIKFFARTWHFVIPKYVHIINVRNLNPLHKPVSNLSCFQKYSYNADMKINDSLSFTLSIRVHEKAQFKVAFRRYLNTGMGSLFWCPSVWNTPETICVLEQLWDLFSGVPISETLQKPFVFQNMYGISFLVSQYLEHSRNYFCSRKGMGSLFWCPRIWNTPETICVPEQVWDLFSGVPVSGTLQKPFVFQNRYGISLLVSQYLEHSRNHLCARTDMGSLFWCPSIWNTP